MIEAEWFSCRDPKKMLTLLAGKASYRKVRLFVTACCRRVAHFLITKHACKNDRLRYLLEACERDANGLQTNADLRYGSGYLLEIMDTCGQENVIAAGEALRLLADSWRFRDPIPGEPESTWLSIDTAKRLARYCVDAVNFAPEGTTKVSGAAERGYQSDVLRCVFGNPFSSVNVDPYWRTETVRSLAQAINEQRAYDRLPILADALEEAGCTDRQLLAHCREIGPHVYGCYVIDLLIAKG